MTAFSNGFEYESWSANWCDRCSREDANAGIVCPILTDVIVINVVPPEWAPGTDDLRDRYHCKEFALT